LNSNSDLQTFDFCIEIHGDWCLRVYLRWKYGQERQLIHIEPMLSVRDSEALEDEIKVSEITKA